MSVGLDLGSSSVKALWLDGRGRPRRLARRRIATRRTPGGRVEHDADEILRATVELLAGAAGAGPLGLATQRSTVLLWDRDSGRPLTPAYSWQDLRGARLCALLARGAPGGSGPGEAGAPERVAARTGLGLSAHYAASKIAWALRHVRGLRERVASGRALWGTLGTFLLWRMTSGAVYAIDHANAQRTSLFALDSLAWDADLFALFGLEDLLAAPILPAPIPTFPSAPIALATRRGDLRLALSTGDQQAALYGLGCREAGDLAINYGSGAFVLINVGDRPLRIAGLLTTLLASWRRDPRRPAPADGGAPVRARYAVEGTVNAAATAIDWALRRLRLPLRTRDLDRFLGSGPEGRRAVHFLPAVSGLGAPRWDAGARPRFSGDPAGSTPRDLLRAVVESIACRCAEILRAARAGGALGGGRGVGAGRGRTPIPVAGGLTRCRSLLQAQADLLQRPLIVRESPDATASGAALLAEAGPAGGAARGFAEIRRHGQSDVTIVPRISADEAEARYRAWERDVYRPRSAPSGGRVTGPAR